MNVTEKDLQDRVLELVRARTELEERVDSHSKTIFEMSSMLSAIQARIVSLETKRTEKADAKQRVADDQDLDSQWGDPIIKYGLKEKYWKEQPDENIGKRFSECSPEYLDATAKYLAACEYMANKNGDEQKARYKERDAARARGWAARKRNGWIPPATDDEAAQFADGLDGDNGYAGDDESIPF